MRVHCTCGRFLFIVRKSKAETLHLVCSSCKKNWQVKIDFQPKLECKCDSVLFELHTPPPHTATKNKVVYLVCDKCCALQEIKFGELTEVDAYGVFKGAKP